MKKVLLIILWVVVLWAIAYIAWPTSEVVTEPEAVSTEPGVIEEIITGWVAEIETGEVEKL